MGISKYLDTTAIDNALDKGVSAYDVVQNLKTVAVTGSYNDLTDKPTKSTLGLGNVDNTSDLSKPISTATQTAINNLQSQLDSAVSSVTVDSEVQQARVGTDGTTYGSLNTRISTEVTNLKEDLSELSETTRNLFFLNDIANYGISVSVNHDGTLKVSGVATAGFIIPIMGNTVYTDTNVEAGNYAISMRVLSGGISTGTFAIYKYETTGTLVGSLTAATSYITKKVELEECALYLRISSGTEINATIAIQIEKGDVVTDYISHFAATDYDARTRVKNSSYLNNKNIVCFGDSIIGNYRDTIGKNEGVPSFISRFTGAICLNLALGGTTATPVNKSDDVICFENVVDAIVDNDWTAIEAYAPTQTSVPYLSQMIVDAKAINWSDVNAIVISYGTNDWNGNADINAYKASLKTGIENLMAIAPNAIVCICTPCIRFFSDGTDSDTKKNVNGKTIPDFANAVKEIARELHLLFVDNYSGLGVNDINSEQFFDSAVTGEKIHPNASGRELIAKQICGVINSYSFVPDKEGSEEIAEIESLVNSVEAKVNSYVKEEKEKISESYNIDFIHENKKINTANGNLYDKDGTSTSDYIDLESAVVYRIEGTTVKTLVSYAFYDADKNFIIGYPDTTSYETTTYDNKTVYRYDLIKPVDARYIRISKSNSISLQYKVDYKEKYYVFNGVMDGFDIKQKAIVTFIDDDFRLECLDNWEDIADRTGIKPTFAVRTNKVGLTSNDPTWDDIDRTRNKGFEFISHTHNHIYLTDETDETIIADFEATIQKLREHNCSSDVLCYPGGRVDDRVKALVKKYFKCAVSVDLKLQELPLDDYRISRISVAHRTEKEEVVIDGQTYEVSRVLSLDEFKSIVDEAVEKGAWLVFMSHFRNTLGDGYYCNDTIRDRMVDVIKYIGSVGCEILPFSEAYDKMKNRVSCGIITDNNHYIVDCNGTVYDSEN